jgi:hypothetical protein
MQLELWGLDYFDLFLVHFPIALAYVDPRHRYPPEWWGDDRKTVSLRAFQFLSFLEMLLVDLCHKRTRLFRRHGARWKSWSTRDL